MATRPRLLIDNQLPLANLFEDVADVVPFDAVELTRDRLVDADALIVRSVSRVDADLLQGTSVRFVGTATSGTDHVDLGYLSEAGITFADAKGANAPSVAQYVFACLALHAEKIGRPVEDLTLGVVGYGHVGSLVGRLAADLGMRVLASDPPLEAEGRTGPWAPLREVLAAADVVTLHVPLKKSGGNPTIDLIGAPELASMRDGAGLINPSRGGVVNEPALYKELAQPQRRIAAYLDVWVGEPNIDTDLAHLCDIATPHIAGYSVESKQRAVQMLRDGLRVYQAGHSEMVRPEDVPGRYTLTQPDNARDFLITASHSFPIWTLSRKFLNALNGRNPVEAFEACRRSVQDRSENL